MYDVGLVLSYIGAVLLLVFAMGYIGANILAPDDAPPRERVINFICGFLCVSGALALAGFFIGSVF